MATNLDYELVDNNLQENKIKVIEFIKNTTCSIINSLIENSNPVIRIKARSNLKLVHTLDFSTEKGALKTSLYLKSLSIIQNLIENNQYATKRELYYQYKHVFKTQETLDQLILDLSNTIDVPRSAFNILTTAKGLMAGNLEILMNDGSLIKCDSIRTGVLIPSYIESIKAIKTNALFTLIIEKDATFQRLIDDQFLTQYQAILITGKGEPDISTRNLVNILYKKYPHMKFFTLTDANPFGILISSIYKFGSKSLANQAEDLNVPIIEHIGLDIRDLAHFNLKNSQQFTFKLTKRDQQVALNLIEKFKLKSEHDLIKQLEYMLSNDCKAELQYLSNISFSFLTEFYLKCKN